MPSNLSLYLVEIPRVGHVYRPQHDRIKTLNTTALAPMPRASVMIAVTVKPGLLRN